MKKALLAGLMLAIAAGAAVEAKPTKDLNCVMLGIFSGGLAYIPGAQCNQEKPLTDAQKVELTHYGVKQ